MSVPKLHRILMEESLLVPRDSKNLTVQCISVVVQDFERTLECLGFRLRREF